MNKIFDEKLQFCKCDISESIIGRGSKLVEYDEKIIW